MGPATWEELLITGFPEHRALNSRVLPAWQCGLVHRPTTITKQRGMKVSIPNETLKAMIRDYNGFELSDEELELVRPELESYLSELKKLEDVDLSDVFSGRLMQIPK